MAPSIKSSLILLSLVVLHVASTMAFLGTSKTCVRNEDCGLNSDCIGFCCGAQKFSCDSDFDCCPGLHCGNDENGQKACVESLEGQNEDKDLILEKGHKLKLGFTGKL